MARLQSKSIRRASCHMHTEIANS